MGVSTLAYALLVGSQCSSLAAVLNGRGVTPRFPKADNSAPQCTWWYDHDTFRPYQEVLDESGLTFDQFRQWNPVIGATGEGWTVGRSYCVEVTFEPATEPRPPPNDRAPSANVEPVDMNGPTPSQPGRIGTCTDFYKVEKGDTCEYIVDKKGTLSLADFYRWNPAVAPDCRAMSAGYYVCVGVPETPTSWPLSRGVSRVQPGITDKCVKYHLAKPGDTCWDISISNGFELDNFYQWNPAVTNDCVGLWAGYNYCIGV